MLSARPVGLPLDLDRGISTKTPGRVLTKTRNGLQENAIRNVPMTVIGKGRKVVQNTPLQPKTLKMDRVLHDSPTKELGPSKLKETLAVRPLGDKTPFPNRTANQPPTTGAKIAKPTLPDGSLRPSSARKHERLPRSAGKAFETPITNGKHWDVSDIEIEVDTSVANQSIEEETFDEIEYMPPKVEDIPYEPPFEMPDYREVGKSLMALIRSYTLEDDPPSNDITFTVDASENNFFRPPSLPQQEIEDDSPFARAKLEVEPKPQPSSTLKQRHTATSKPTARPTVQRTTSGTRPTGLANPRVTPAVRRTPDTSSARPPTTAARKSISQPVTRAPTSQSTMRAPVSRATTRAGSTPPVHASTTRPSRVPSVSRPTIRPAVRPAAPTAPARGKPAPTKPSVPPARNRASSDAPLNAITRNNTTTRPRSGTITKAAFEANTHVVVHIRNNSLEDVKKDLEGLVVFDDAFDDEDGFRFEV